MDVNQIGIERLGRVQRTRQIGATDEHLDPVLLETRLAETAVLPRQHRNIVAKPLKAERERLHRALGPAPAQARADRQNAHRLLPREDLDTSAVITAHDRVAVSYTHLRAHETPEH